MSLGRSDSLYNTSFRNLQKKSFNLYSMTSKNDDGIKKKFTFRACIDAFFFLAWFLVSILL
jgi:hypothetical protein